jgi:hypothetical protein
MNKLTESESGEYECRIITGNEIDQLKFEVKYENGILTCKKFFFFLKYNINVFVYFQEYKNPELYALVIEPESDIIKLKVGESLDLSCFSNSVYRPTEIQLFHNNVKNLYKFIKKKLV